MLPVQPPFTNKRINRNSASAPALSFTRHDGEILQNGRSVISDTYDPQKKLLPGKLSHPSLNQKQVKKKTKKQ